MNLTTEYMHQGERSRVSYQRDRTSAAGRPDCNRFVASMHHKFKWRSKKESMDLLNDDSMFGCSNKKEEILRHCAGATHVRIQDVCKMTKIMKEERARLFDLHDDEGNKIRQITFTARWPRMLNLVCPCADECGNRFEMHNGVQCSLMFWLIVNITHMIDTLWECTDQHVVDNKLWLGWILAFTHHNVLNLHHQTLKVKSENPFLSCKLKTESLNKMIVNQFNSKDSYYVKFKKLCSMMPTALVSYDCNVEPIHLKNRRVIIVAFDDNLSMCREIKKTHN